MPTAGQAIHQARLGPDHFDVARSLDNLGLTLRRLGQLDTARDAHQHALDIHEAQLGPTTPPGLRPHQPRLRRLPARGPAYYQGALDIYKARLGADHPTPPVPSPTSPTCSTTLVTWPPPCRLERAQAIFEARFGLDHPDLAQTRKNLPIVLDELRKAPANRTPTAGPLPLLEARSAPGTRSHTDTQALCPGPTNTQPGSAQSLHQRELTAVSWRHQTNATARPA